MNDLNCDLGEGESLRKTKSLMAVITSANIACGAHAGDERTIKRCLALCREFAVRAGAHPGFAVRKTFGRKEIPITGRQFASLVLEQAGTFARLAETEGVLPHHIKLHGALYHAVERSAALSRCYVRLVRDSFPGWKIYASPFGKVAKAARRAGVETWREVFADRAYLPSGGLAPRGEPGSMISPPAEAAKRMRCFFATGILTALDGTPVRIEAETVCVHGDAPGAVKLAKTLAGLINVARREGNSH